MEEPAPVAPRYKCNDCTCSFKYVKHLKTHLANECGKELHCLDCGTKFKSMKGQKGHKCPVKVSVKVSKIESLYDLSALSLSALSLLSLCSLSLSLSLLALSPSLYFVAVFPSRNDQFFDRGQRPKG